MFLVIRLTFLYSSAPFSSKRKSNNWCDGRPQLREKSSNFRRCLSLLYRLSIGRWQRKSMKNETLNISFGRQRSTTGSDQNYAILGKQNLVLSDSLERFRITTQPRRPESRSLHFYCNINR